MEPGGGQSVSRQSGHGTHRADGAFARRRGCGHGGVVQPDAVLPGQRRHPFRLWIRRLCHTGGGGHCAGRRPVQARRTTSLDSRRELLDAAGCARRGCLIVHGQPPVGARAIYQTRPVVQGGDLRIPRQSRAIQHGLGPHGRGPAAELVPESEALDAGHGATAHLKDLHRGVSGGHAERAARVSENLAQRTRERLGEIDVMVFATGTNVPDRSMRRLTTEIWDMMVSVNLSAAYYITGAVLAPMREKGAGHLIYISSVSGLFADVSGAAYQASKRGLLGLAHAIRVEEKENGI